MSAVIARFTLSQGSDLAAVEEAIQTEALCDKGVQSSLLCTMTYITFKKRCIDALAGRSAGPWVDTYHLSSGIKLTVSFPDCILQRKGPATAAAEERKRKSPDLEAQRRLILEFHPCSKVLKTRHS